MINIHIGVLALQGAFSEHCEALERCWKGMRSRGEVDKYNLSVVEVRTQNDLYNIKGLVLPGGESTTMSLIMGRNDFYDTLKDWLSGEYRKVEMESRLYELE